MNEKIKTVVDRRTWLRGPYALGGVSVLLNEDGMRCCLGFRLALAGLSNDALAGQHEPGDFADFTGMPPWLTQREEDYGASTSDVAYQAMSYNDDTDIDDAERERLITDIFARNGEEIEFVGPRLPKVDGREVRYEDVETEG